MSTKTVISSVTTGFFILVGLVGVFQLGCSSRELASEEATTWALQNGIQGASVSCVSFDTDGDGYVSCTVSAVKPNGDREIIPIECAARFRLNSGCRLQKGILRN